MSALTYPHLLCLSPVHFTAMTPGTVLRNQGLHSKVLKGIIISCSIKEMLFQLHVVLCLAMATIMIISDAMFFQLVSPLSPLITALLGSKPTPVIEQGCASFVSAFYPPTLSPRLISARTYSLNRCNPNKKKIIVLLFLQLSADENLLSSPTLTLLQIPKNIVVIDLLQTLLLVETVDTS